MDNNTYDLVVYDVNEAVIGKLADTYLKLKVNGIEDKANYEIVRKARLDVVKHRTAIEKERKRYKEKALKYGRDVDAEAKRLTALLEPVEDHLTEQENIVLHEIERKKKEAEEKEAARLQSRIDRLFSIGCTFNGQNYILPFAPNGYATPSAIIKAANDEQFECVCAEYQKLVDAEQRRIAEEKAAKEAEEERLEQIRIEQEKERQRLETIAREQAEKEAKIKAEQERKDAEIRARQEEIEREEKRIADEEAARLKEIADAQALEAAKKEAAERAVKEAEEKARREAEEKAEQERLAKIEADRQKALQPDKDKLIAFANLIDTLAFPEVKDDAAKSLLSAAKKTLSQISDKIRKEARSL